jgi:hypothetical protein
MGEPYCPVCKPDPKEISKEMVEKTIEGIKEIKHGNA